MWAELSMEILKWGKAWVKNHAVFSSYPSLRFPHAAPCLSQKSDSASRGISWARLSPPAVDYESHGGWNSSPPPLKPGQKGSPQDWNLETKLSGLFVHSFFFFFISTNHAFYQSNHHLLVQEYNYIFMLGQVKSHDKFTIPTAQWKGKSHFYGRALSKSYSNGCSLVSYLASCGWVSERIEWVGCF